MKSTTVKRLYALSGNRCAFPRCRARLIQHDVVVGEMCHIKAKEKGGPRYDENQSEEAREAFENFVLMCSTHHKIVDTKPDEYPVEILYNLKDKHERKFEQWATPQEPKLNRAQLKQWVFTLNTSPSVRSINQQGGQTAHQITNIIHQPHSPAAAPDRPELYVQRAIAQPLIVGKPKCVVLQVKNVGRSTAYNVSVWANHADAAPDFPGPLKFEYLEPDTRPDIARDEVVSFIGRSKVPLTKSEFEAFERRSRVWFQFGRGTYEDGAGIQYPFDFCYTYDPSVGHDLIICPDRYWPKRSGGRPSVIRPRPEVFLESAEGHCSVGNPPEVTIFIKNRGQLTAHRIEIETTHYFAHARTFKGPVEHIANVPPNSYPSLASGAEAMGRIEGGDPFTAQDVNDIETGKLLFLNYSRGHYEDESGNVYPIEFCVMYDPGRPLMKYAPKTFSPVNGVLANGPPIG